jgi:DNA-binding transcriptional regulator GbsR (MarR family)
VSDQERRYVEEFGTTLARMGLPPAYGKVLGWLLICDPPSQSVTEIAHATGLSKGSVSTASRLLASGDLIKRATRPGRRGTFYEMGADAIMRVIEDGSSYRRFIEILDRGIDVLGGPDNPRTDRLRETRNFYAFIEKELATLVERYKTTGR